MNRIYQIILIASALLGFWLGIEAIHELGHLNMDDNRSAARSKVKTRITTGLDRYFQQNVIMLRNQQAELQLAGAAQVATGFKAGEIVNNAKTSAAET